MRTDPVDRTLNFPVPSLEMRRPVGNYLTREQARIAVESGIVAAQGRTPDVLRAELAMFRENLDLAQREYEQSADHMEILEVMGLSPQSLGFMAGRQAELRWWIPRFRHSLVHIHRTLEALGEPEEPTLDTEREVLRLADEEERT